MYISIRVVLLSCCLNTSPKTFPKPFQNRSKNLFKINPKIIKNLPKINDFWDLGHPRGRPRWVGLGRTLAAPTEISKFRFRHTGPPETRLGFFSTHRCFDFFSKIFGNFSRGWIFFESFIFFFFAPNQWKLKKMIENKTKHSKIMEKH